jgi:hypothetical protein
MTLDVRYRLCIFWPEKSQDACRASTDSMFVCDMNADIGFVFFGHETSQDACRTSTSRRQLVSYFSTISI